MADQESLIARLLKACLHLFLFPAIPNLDLQSFSFITPYILRRLRTGSPSDETPCLPNKEMTKPCEVSDETSTNLFPHF